jgi:GNAT superfamily N-acetyltransferase
MILMAHQPPSPSPGRPRFWVFDIYRREKLVGWTHCSVYVDRETLEIEELFVMPESRRLGVGVRLLKAVEDLAKFCMVSKMRGWIHRQDLLSGRYQIVKSFFSRNGFQFYYDPARFRDAEWLIEKSTP